MRGIYHNFFEHWPDVIERNHNDPQKEIRYNIGQTRLALIQKIAEPFAYSVDHENNQFAAFLTVLEEGDLNMKMPESTRAEYICGKKTAEGHFSLFAYIWFDSIEKAKEYASKKGMRIEGGWNE